MLAIDHTRKLRQLTRYKCFRWGRVLSDNSASPTLVGTSPRRHKSVCSVSSTVRMIPLFSYAIVHMPARRGKTTDGKPRETHVKSHEAELPGFRHLF